MHVKVRNKITTRKKKIQKTKKYRKLNNITTSKRKIQKTKKYRKLNKITRIKSKNTKWGGEGDDTTQRPSETNLENKQTRTPTILANKTMKLDLKEGQYEGQVNKNGEMDGEGTMFYKPIIDKNDKIYNEYVGQWKNNKREGEGIMMYNNGKDVYQGEWENDKKDGNGKMTYANGDVHEGIWVEDVYIGKWDIIGYNDSYGKMTYANGDVFEGELFKDDKYKKNSGGIMTYKDGKKILGYWKDDILVNYLDENLGITIHRVNSPEEIKEGNKYLVMHNIIGEVSLYFGNININKEKKYASHADFNLDIIMLKNLTDKKSDWVFPTNENKLHILHQEGNKYKLYTNDIRSNPFFPKQFDIIIFAFEDNMQRYVNEVTNPGELAKKPLSLNYLSYLKLSEEEKNALKEDTNFLDNIINPFA